MMRFSLPLLALSALPFAPADSARAGSAQTGPVAEIVTFRLAKGVSDAQFVEISKASEGFVKSAPGFISRNLSLGEDGRWTDYVLWRDMASAKQMAEAFMSEPSVAPLMQAIDPNSVAMRHEAVLWQMQQ